MGPKKLARLEMGELFRLDEECRRQKEALHPNSRRIVVDLDVVREGMGQVSIPVADYYRSAVRCWRRRWSRRLGWRRWEKSKRCMSPAEGANCRWFRACFGKSLDAR